MASIQIGQFECEYARNVGIYEENFRESFASVLNSTAINLIGFTLLCLVFYSRKTELLQINVPTDKNK